MHPKSYQVFEAEVAKLLAWGPAHVPGLLWRLWQEGHTPQEAAATFLTHKESRLA